MQTFAVIPAAGQSRRMGRPKLMLPWEGKAVIEHVLTAWQQAAVDDVVVVAHPEAVDVQQMCEKFGATVVVPPTAPAEMKDSVQIGLQYVARQHAPAGDSLWLLAPADMPRLSADVIKRVIAAAGEHPGAIVIPTHQGQSGHPAAFPWPMAREVEHLSADEGINALLTRHRVVRLDCEDPTITEDLDTPQDYQRLRNR